MTTATASTNGTLHGSLHKQHLADLYRSGLSDGQIEACRFATISPQKSQQLLRWKNHGDRLGYCLSIPYWNPDGTPSGYHRLKPDQPREKNGKPVKYEAPIGLGNHAYFPPGVIPVLNDTGVSLLIVEGEKKAAKADQEGFPCIGICGVYNWQKKLKRDAAGKAIGPRELIDDLAKIPWTNRTAHIAFDFDPAETTARNVGWATWHLSKALQDRGAVVKVITLPPGPAGADGNPTKQGLDDYLVSHSADDLRKLIDAATSSERPEPPERPAQPAAAWPEISGDAFYGVAGDAVRTIGPHSEADPAALLLQILIAFGNAIGRTAHFEAEGDLHYLNLFGVLIGRTGKGRKGSSFGQVKRLLEPADARWFNDRVMGGLSSGEGLIWQCRDPIVKREPIKERGRITGYQEVEVDPGIEDKRLLVFEPEFASVLRVLDRQGNTLSTMVRQAWESGNLRTLTKNSPARATAAHISIVAHITIEELRRYLSATEMANGLANRFLWIVVRRSKSLPEGGALKNEDLDPLRSELREAIIFARNARRMIRDDQAAEAWRAIYGSLSRERAGLAGAMLSRAEAQTMRIACIYALLDHSNVIRFEHLKAAVALWEYIEASVVYVFGDSLGSPLADEIMRALLATPKGMTRNDIRVLVGKHVSGQAIGQALNLLLENRLARFAKEETGGRPSERWFATGVR